MAGAKMMLFYHVFRRGFQLPQVAKMVANSGYSIYTSYYYSKYALKVGCDKNEPDGGRKQKYLGNSVRSNLFQYGMCGDAL